MGADVVAWKWSVLAEAAAGMGWPYASTLSDLVRASHSVSLDWLAKQAVKFGCDLWLLRLSIAAYLFGRVLDVGGCCSMVV